MNTKVLLIISLFSSSILMACQQKVESTSPENSSTAETNASTSATYKKEEKENNIEEANVKNILPYKGTIQYVDLEGGFFGITTDKGTKLLPMGLPKEYLQHGAIIEFSGEKDEDVMTIQQWGTPFKIKDIKLVKPGKPVNRGGKHELM
ncbi:hypothetical protein FLL45_09140 [Aliikangiella marina]|uniref:Pilus assembly protein PilP n=1 Tax=Aliikangiella marina TaxID=1712262 RepID=A0A545TD46_9GAMM|nr:hypothetical protein [Aliikangiella marina]TQV75096.1 hypothetical protein FLL45_09140 [Aliikangiella marina]